MYEQARTENEQSKFFKAFDPVNEHWPDEDIFVVQLHRRATLLNHGFQTKLKDVILQHKVVNNTNLQASTMKFSNFSGQQLDRQGFNVSNQFRLEINGHACLTQGRESEADETVSLQNGVSDETEASKVLETVSNKTWLDFRSWNFRAKEQESVSVHTFNEKLMANICRRDSTSSAIIAHAVSRILCQFQNHTAFVEIYPAPIKTTARMREKVVEYEMNQQIWPFSANILDPIRASIVCNGPAEIMEVVSWFASNEDETGLRLCRIKNKFAFSDDDLLGGYRDVMVSVIFEGVGGLRIIGEIQVHDRTIFELKLKVCILLLSLPMCLKSIFLFCIVCFAISIVFEYYFDIPKL